MGGASSTPKPWLCILRMKLSAASTTARMSGITASTAPASRTSRGVLQPGGASRSSLQGEEQLLGTR